MYPLKVYKASAGSGKTFTLAVEYIKLLVADPLVYKHILAVTFTNKATAEMKNRIVSQLYGIGESLEKSDQYLDAIKKDEGIARLRLSDGEIRRRARLALSNIIHDYSRFHIATIDSFFQSIVRDLARELDLTANLKLDLNDGEVLSEAVKAIIDELQEGTEMFKSIMGFVMEKIEEGKNWNIENEIVTFGANIFNEQFLEKEMMVREKISDKEFLKEYKARIISIRKKMEDEVHKCGADFLKLCTRDGLSINDFKQGSRGIYAFFTKICSGNDFGHNNYVANCINTPTEWVKKANMAHIIGNEYLKLLNNTLSIIGTAEKAIATSSTIIAHINHLMMLDMINNKVRALNSESNRFLLADTARFLRDIIDGSDIPFIYERTGNKFKHIMIDEFQDTSALQWENFKPLLSNSLSQNHTCLIVGDVKQSIYRWRNSDWNILNNIQTSCFGDKVDPQTIDKLDTNHRSKEAVIDFNNKFFSKASTEIAKVYDDICGRKTNDIHTAYGSVVQKIREDNKNSGFVRITDISTSTQDGDNYTEQTLSTLKSSIEEVISKGVSPNQITILVRNNEHTPKICQYFIEQGSPINIVSEDAFKLNASAAVNIIIQALRCVDKPDDKLSRLTLSFLYQTEVKNNTEIGNDIANLLSESDNMVERFLPENFCKNIHELTMTPLGELVEKIYDIFELDRIDKQDAYLFCFYDLVTAFLQDNSSSLSEFLTHWDEKLKDKTIPENAVDGIRIMTIHKSKGLEFHTVFIPFCNWGMDGRASNLLWCQPSEEPYNDLPLTPVNYTKATQTSIFQKDYEQETLKCFVDNLNILYVGFTRAECNLFVITGSNNSKGYSTNKVILSSLPDNMQKEEDGKLTTYSVGSLTISSEKGKPQTENEEEEEDNNPNILTRTPKPVCTRFEHHPRSTDFRQSNMAELFTNDIDEAERQAHYINEGNLTHRMLELMTQPEDIDKAARQMLTEGSFKDTNEMKRIYNKVKKVMANKRVKEWFSPRWTVLNERSILSWDEEGQISPIRPDRVLTDGKETIVIDYKTGKKSDKHFDQVGKYMDHLVQMGHTNVKGYIWYIGSDEVIPV